MAATPKNPFYWPQHLKILLWYYYIFCGCDATIEEELSFICGHAAMLLQSENFEIDTPGGMARWKNNLIARNVYKS